MASSMAQENSNARGLIYTDPSGEYDENNNLKCSRRPELGDNAFAHARFLIIHIYNFKAML